MVSAPPYKVYRGKEYVAACKHPQDAAVLVGYQPDGTVRLHHKQVLYRNGEEHDGDALESFDQAAVTISTRHNEISEKSRRRKEVLSILDGISEKSRPTAR